MSLRQRRNLPLVPLVVWLLLAAPLALIRHRALETHAYDLSVFDYALWSTLQGRLGHVPFIGHSLFAHHFMPTLLVLLPPYALAPSPVFLIVAQLSLTAAAVVALAKLASTQVAPEIAAALCASFLFSRPSYNAIMSVFYIESAIPLLVFLMLFAWWRRRWGLYWAAVVLALGCKEDVALYVAGFGLLCARRPEHRRVALLTVLLAVAWLAFAIGYAIPAARAADGLPTANPFLESRYGGPEGVSLADAVWQRLLTTRPWVKLFNLTTSVGLLCWAAPAAFAPAFPGILLNLAARPEALQSAFAGHYAWAVLPWMFAAAVEAASRACDRWPRLKGPLAVVLLIPAVLDTPLWLELSKQPWTRVAAASQVREQLARIPAEASLTAQGNLIPHIPHRRILLPVNEEDIAARTDYLLLSELGVLWPLDSVQTQARIEKYRHHPEYEVISDGPLFAFRNKARSAEPAEPLPARPRKIR